MDAWTAPEPSPYFDSKLRARVREAAAAQPEGLFERLYAFLTFSTGLQWRSAMAGALMLVLLIGGGSFAGFEYANRAQPQPSATVNDLKILDNNAQASAADGSAAGSERQRRFGGSTNDLRAWESSGFTPQPPFSEFGRRLRYDGRAADNRNTNHMEAGAPLTRRFTLNSR